MTIMLNAIYVLVAGLVASIFGILLFNYLFYNRYVDKSETHCLAALVFTVSMSVALLCVLLIPIDVFLASQSSTKAITETINVVIDRDIFNKIMYASFTISLFLSFVSIPFTFFYIDEKIEDIMPVENEFMTKLFTSFKHTLFFLLFIGIILLFGLFFRSESSPLTTTDTFKTLKIILDTEHFGDKAITFVITLFGIFGMIIVVFYGGYGLGSLPFYLIKGKKSLESSHERFEFDRAKARDRIRSLQEKMTRKGTLSSKEKKELAKLKEEEILISNKMDKINSILENDNCFNTILSMMTPFRVLIGICCLIMTLLAFISLLLTSLDRLMHSECGLSCGFVIKENKFKNYVDHILILSSQFLHLDQVLFAIINLYFYFCAIFGFCNIGIKIFCCTLYEVKRRSTNPQGLLILAFELSIMTIAFVLEIMALCPQYATFGSQVTSDGMKCNLTSDMRKCVMTNIAVFFNKISMSLPLFSSIFYFANWLLIGVISISFIYSMLCKEDEEFDDYRDEGDDEEKFALNDDVY